MNVKNEHLRSLNQDRRTAACASSPNEQPLMSTLTHYFSFRPPKSYKFNCNEKYQFDD